MSDNRLSGFANAGGGLEQDIFSAENSHRKMFARFEISAVTLVLSSSLSIKSSSEVDPYLTLHNIVVRKRIP